MRSTYRKVVSRTVLSLLFVGAFVWALPQEAADNGRAKEIAATSDTSAPPVGVSSSPALRRAPAAAAVRPLLSRVEGGGTVRVIVGLNTPFHPEGSLPSVVAAHTQQANIAAAQDELLIRLEGAGVAAVKKFPFIPYVAMEVGADGLTLLQSSPEVASVEEDVPIPIVLAESVPLVGGTAAWAAGYSGVGQAVAILDTGVDKTHPFFSGKVVSEACYSTTDSSYSSLCPGGVTESTSPGSGVNCDPATNADCKHGTHVAGIAAGRGANASGLAKDAGIIAVQVFSRPNTGGSLGAFTSDMIRGLQRVQALSGTLNIAAANLSIGGGVQTSSCDDASPAFKAAVDSLRSVGVATVIASGNGSSSTGVSFPACISSAISVGSTDDGSHGTAADQVSNFSNSAPMLKLLAPGRWINSSVPGGVFENFSGTSMAAPHVAGAWAVLKSKSPSATVDQVLSALTSTGVPITDTRNNLTRPRIKVDAALSALVPSTVQVTVQTNPAGHTFTVDGTTFAATQTFTWTPGSSHTIGTTSPQGGEAGTRFVWSSWSDGGAIMHTVAPASDTTYTANFTTQYFLTMNAGAGGTVSPPSGWFDSGQSVPISAAPSGGFVFSGWSGTGAGSFTGTSNPASVTMNGPISETASFSSSGGGGRRNVALAANGATATASSTLDAGRLPVAVINGDRRGQHWASDPSTGSGWHDATQGVFPDWVQINFGGSTTIDEISVFTVQDDFANPAEPTDSMTFTQYGVTAFDVQYWDGSTWVTVPGGSVTGNNKVWRKVIFSPLATDRIRVSVNAALAGYSRITEVEAYQAGGGSAPGTNVALASNGAQASASSTLDAGRLPVAAINGDRRGVHWASDPTTGSGWHDATADAYPDWLQVDFNGAKTIDRVNVFSIQDDYNNPAEPTDAMTFTQFGITAFDVQYWDGSAWVTLPGGSVTGNNKVWRSFTFPAITVSKIRVLVNNALASYSRIAEVEAFEVSTPPRTNVALAGNGGVATASSTYSPGYPASAVNNGDRKGLNWGAGGGWNDASPGSFPDWLQVDFNGAKTIDEVNVFTIQDDFANPAEPTDATTFTQYGITAFEVQFWNGASWATVPGGSVTGNNKVWRKFTFSPLTTDRIRVLVNNALASYSRIAEVEAFEAGGPPRFNLALAGNGAVATASSTYSTGFPAGAVNNGDRKGLNWGAGGGWNDASPGSFPDWVQIDLNGSKSIREIDVFTIQDDFANPAEPTDAMTFTQFGITAFDVQYWDGSAWVTVPGGSVTGNNRIKRTFTFAPLTTDRVRVLVNNALAGYSRLAEVEVY